MSKTNRITVHPLPDASGFIAARPSLYVARLYVGGALRHETSPQPERIMRGVTVPMLRAKYSVRSAMWCQR